jgi:DNA recombination protein RmuC
MNDSLFVFALAAAVIAAIGIAVLLFIVVRLSQRVSVLTAQTDDAQRDLAASVNQQLANSGRDVQQSLLTQLGVFQTGLTQAVQGASSAQGQSVQALTQALQTQVAQLSETNEKRLMEVRVTLDQRLREMAADSEKKLEQMRVTVDEKLHATLEQRLGESFKLVVDRLEQVHRGLGEMQTLATGVGDLKHLLTNVKTRGIFGEAQLGALLEQVLSPEQFAAQVATKPGSREVVDFAVKLPGKNADGAPCWLPIDAKFPSEDYQRLLEAQERADAAGAETAAKALEGRLRLEAKSIAEKYVSPPHTTDFAILFLPTEGLYAEALRRVGLMEALQRDHRVTLAGPTTLLAMLSSFAMGFRTLAMEQRASEVWQVLGAVKTEFGKFGEVLAKTRKKLEEAQNTIGEAEVRTRAMDRRLKSVEALPGEEAREQLGLDSDQAESSSNLSS